MKTAIYGVGAFSKLFFKALNKKVDFFIDNYANITKLYLRNGKAYETIYYKL